MYDTSNKWISQVTICISISRYNGVQWWQAYWWYWRLVSWIQGRGVGLVGCMMSVVWHEMRSRKDWLIEHYLDLAGGSVGAADLQTGWRRPCCPRQGPHRPLRTHAHTHINTRPHTHTRIHPQHAPLLRSAGPVDQCPQRQAQLGTIFCYINARDTFLSWMSHHYQLSLITTLVSSLLQCQYIFQITSFSHSNSKVVVTKCNTFMYIIMYPSFITGPGLDGIRHYTLHSSTSVSVSTNGMGRQR